MSTSHSSLQGGSRSSVRSHVDDEARLAALRRYDILDTEPEPAFDRITELAAHLFDAPTAIVNFVDANRQWFKSTVGFAEDETGLDVSFCVYTVEKGDVFVVENLAEDERFTDNPYVTDHGVRFYAGAPLITPDDRRLGTLCVLDTEPRSPSEAALDRLADLAAMVVDELELRREQAEHEQSRELLRHAQELAHVGGWAYDPQADTLNWTDEAYRIHDLPPDADIDVTSALDFYVPEDRPVIESHVETLLEEGGQYDLELTIETAEGTRKRVRTMGRAQRTDGKTTRVTGAIQDITEAHRHEQALRESENRWQRLVDKHPGPIHVSVGGKFVYANEAAVALHGVASEDDLIGRDLREFVHPEEMDRLEERGQVVYEDREETELDELRIRRADGTDRIVLIRSVPIQYMGEPAAQTMMRDVTERREAERELRRSEKKFRTVVEHAQPMTFMVDRDGTILLSEGGDLQSLGLEPGEAVGKSMYDRYANSPSVISAVERALDGEYVDEEVQFNDLVLDAWYSPFYNEEGEVAGVIGMAADITERRQTQRELRRQREILQTIFDNVPVMIALVKEGQFELANPQFEKVTGWAEEDVTDTSTLLKKLYPDSEVRDEVLAFMEEHPDEWRDFPLHTKDGDILDTTWTNVELSDGRIIGIGLDISERKAWERELEESYQRLRLALEAANAGTFEYDMATDRVRWDGRSLNLYGLDLDAGVQEADRLGTLVLDEDLDHLDGVFEQAVENGEPRYDVSYRIRRADDGELRHIHSHGLVLRKKDGTADRVIGINRDVTEEKERQKRLRLLGTAVEQSPATVLITEANSIDEPGPKTVYANPAFTEMTGYDRDDIIGQSPRMLQGPDTDQAALDRIRMALENEEPVREVVLNYTKEGTPYWSDLYIAPVRDEDGTVTHFVSIQQDVTERKEAEQDLRRSREQLSMAVEGGNIGTWNWDMETDEVIFNRRWAEMLGYSREELDFHFSTWEELVHPEDLPRAMGELSAYIEGTASTYAPEIRMRTKSGEWKWIQTIGKVVERDEEGSVTRAAGIHLDIDDRKRAETAVREAKTRYQTLVENFPDGGVFLFDEDLECIIAGGEGLEAAGLSPSGIVGERPRDRYPEEIAEELESYYRRALKGEEHIFEQTYRGRHYRVQTLPVQSEEGEVVSGMSVSQDITERKESRRRLERYREYTARLLDAIDDLFFAIDEEARLQRWNSRIPEVTGYSDDELDTITAFDLVPEREHERVEARIGDAFAAGSARVEVPLLRKDGTTIPYEFVGSLVENPEGALQVVGIGRDISERLRQEKVLERQNDLFTKAQDIANVGAWEYDVQSDETIVTDEVYHILGLEPGVEIGPKSTIDLYHPDDRDRIREAFNRAIDEVENYDLELRAHTPAGEQRWVRTRGEPQMEDGEVIRIRGTIQDVTEQVRRRNELESAKEAAEEADRIKSALLSNMNHEFRTPLTSILTFSELIRDNPDVADRFIDRILGGGERLLYTLNTVMDFAELEGDNRSVTPRPFHLAETVRSVASDFREEARQNDIDIVVDISGAARGVALDQHVVERILTHLVHNAVKFTEEGRVTVSAETNGAAVLRVTDTGMGIEPDFLPKVFDEFAQASSGYNRTHEGNGLGLTIVKRFVEAMDGTIDVESELGEGTTVTVRLPLKGAE